MADHHILGQKGEALAVDYLKDKGYQIVTTNWRKHKYEIDIIAQHLQEIVFVEVKTRSTSFFGNPEEAVNKAKQIHLIDGADFYIQENEIDLDARFDVVSIVLNKNTQEIQHITDAFCPTA